MVQNTWTQIIHSSRNLVGQEYITFNGKMYKTVEKGKSYDKDKRIPLYSIIDGTCIEIAAVPTAIVPMANRIIALRFNLDAINTIRRTIPIREVELNLNRMKFRMSLDKFLFNKNILLTKLYKKTGEAYILLNNFRARNNGMVLIYPASVN